MEGGLEAIREARQSIPGPSVACVAESTPSRRLAESRSGHRVPEGCRFRRSAPDNAAALHPLRRSSIPRVPPSRAFRFTLLPEPLAQRTFALEIRDRIVQIDAMLLQETVEFVVIQSEQFGRLIVGQTMAAATLGHQGLKCRAR